jgi:brefeldin A-resistance guanine nucleotide exchange factor 1
MIERDRPQINWIQLVQNEITAVTTNLCYKRKVPLLEFKDRKGIQNVCNLLNSTESATANTRHQYGFERLQKQLCLVVNQRDFDPLSLVSPFLNVIKSGDTSGASTIVALNSIETFIVSRIVGMCLLN